MAGAMEVDNSWIFESTLGQGSFGIVELWKNIHSDEKIAIKKCKSGLAQLTLRQKERWIQEINIMNKLNHANIIATKPVPKEVTQAEASLPVLCMEYCRKRDLRKVLNETENCCGFAEPVAIQIMKDISSAVEYLHGENITHRDLKPENVVLQQSDNKVVYKLIDLGYAKELGHDSVYASVVGTMNYIAPELLWNKKYTCTVDYWSLGILFYEIITGCRPFLPNESNPITWKKHIEQKSYEDIAVRCRNSKVIYLQDIQDPTDISPCIRDALVDWFRIVLQWDPKRRGKLCGGNKTDEIVVFRMLKRILTKKVVRIFDISRYELFSYEIDGTTTTIKAIKSLIENDCKISISSQELIDSLGNVLKDDTVVQDTFLTLFRKECTQLIDLPAPSWLAFLEKLIEVSKTEINRYELKCYYAEGMFFMKKEVELFRYYILALSMKIDLIISKLDMLLSKRSDMISEIDSLKTEFESTRTLLQSSVRTENNYWQREIQTAMEKLENLTQIVNDLKTKCDKFLRIGEMLREFVDIEWMIEYEEFISEAEDIVDGLKNRHPQYKEKPISMTKLVGKFLTFRHTMMKQPKVYKIGSQIKVMTTPQATEELAKLEKFVESAIALTTVYRDEISNLQKKWQNQRRVACSEVNRENMDIEGISDDFHSSVNYSHGMNETICGNTDNVIMDNLVIRYMMHDVMTDTHDKFLKTVNLDS